MDIGVYEKVYKLAMKEYRNKTMHGEWPYLWVLDEILSHTEVLKEVDLGLVDIPLNQIKIHATDIDKQILAAAKTGLYAEKSLAGVPKDFKEKYFTKVGNSYQISNEIKSRVEFHEHNLLKDAYPKNYHFIVCRNVLIYFTEEAKDDVYKKFCASLKPGAILFLGSTEQIIQPQQYGFQTISSFFYKKA